MAKRKSQTRRRNKKAGSPPDPVAPPSEEELDKIYHELATRSHEDFTDEGIALKSLLASYGTNPNHWNQEQHSKIMTALSRYQLPAKTAKGGKNSKRTKRKQNKGGKKSKKSKKRQRKGGKKSKKRSKRRH